MLKFLSVNIFLRIFSPLFLHTKTRHATRDGFNFKHFFSCIFCIFCKITLFVFFVFPNCNPQRKVSSNQTFSCLLSSTHIMTICTCGSIVRIITLNADIHAANTSTNAEPISSLLRQSYLSAPRRQPIQQWQPTQQ